MLAPTHSNQWGIGTYISNNDKSIRVELFDFYPKGNAERRSGDNGLYIDRAAALELAKNLLLTVGMIDRRASE